jgi:hypothetical protein
MRIAAIMVMAVCLASAGQADEGINRIYKLYASGDLQRAAEEYRQLPAETGRDGNRLFLSALFETDGRKAYDLLRAAVESSIDENYEKEARFRLIQLTEALGDTAQARSAAAVFLDHAGAGLYRAQILAILAVHASRDGAEQDRYLGQLADQFAESYYGRLALLMKAGTAGRQGHYKAANAFCRQLTASPEDDLTPAGLILAAEMALSRGESETALLNYNILRERYPTAIGQEKLAAALQDVSESQTGKEASEVITGVTYSVQVGVFSEKDNAKRMEERIKAYGYSTRIAKRAISGSTYHVVLAGKFPTMNDAQAARQKLERGENEVFKVVVNDEK